MHRVAIKRYFLFVRHCGVIEKKQRPTHALHRSSYATLVYATDTDLTADNLLRLPAEFGCPVWVYDAQIIRRQIAQLSQFDVVRFAQKACSNIHILRLMREQGVKVDSVSLGEIERALAAGYDPQQNPEDIVFTADLIDDATLDRVKALQIPVNAARSTC